MSTDPKADTFMESFGSKSILWREPLNMAALISLPESFNVK